MTDLERLVWQAAVSFIAGGLGALVAGYFGVRFGLARVKRERAFDRRFDWYQRTVNVLHTAANQYLFARVNVRRGLPVDQQSLRAALAGIYSVTAEADLYARPDSVAELLTAVRELERLSSFMTGAPTEQRFVDAERACVIILRGTGRKLANEARAQLGLELLKPDDGAVEGKEMPTYRLGSME